jgi:hypothetical protein
VVLCGALQALVPLELDALVVLDEVDELEVLVAAAPPLPPVPAPPPPSPVMPTSELPHARRVKGRSRMVCLIPSVFGKARTSLGSAEICAAREGGWRLQPP